LHEAIDARLSTLMIENIEDYKRYLQFAEHKQIELEYWTIFLTSGESYFFRDQGQFALLRDELLPGIIEQRKEMKRMRIWSAGCSTGEEPYSLAILLLEILPDIEVWDVSIIASDINAQALTKAQLAIYSDWSFRGVDASVQQRYFHRCAEGWELNQEVVKWVHFEHHDLLADMIPNRLIHDIDLILCRNTFIYFNQQAIATMVKKMSAALVDGGFLMVGHTELQGVSLQQLHPKMFQSSMLYQKEHGDGFDIEAVKSCQQDPSTLRMASMCSPSLAPHRLQSSEDWPWGRRVARAKEHDTATVMPPMPSMPSMQGTRIEKAWRYANQGMFEQAEMLCRQALAESPLHFEPYFLLSKIVHEQGHDVECEHLLKQVIYLDPDYVAAYLDLADLYMDQDRLPLAKKMREIAKKILEGLPADSFIDGMGKSRVDAVLIYLETMLQG
ncbi:MAG: hypothetical protein HQM07_09545, partial [Zetaproteobacteria bacterium]|nr:hypothetical protein [Zetaproteobacteria bacterium]